MSFRIVHISDIHFGRHCRYKLMGAQTPQAAGETAALELRDDLSRHGYNSEFKAIVASGDLTWENKPVEFATTAHFLTKLAELLHVPMGHVVVIPGNHDITWSEADPSYAKGYQYLFAGIAESGYRQFYSDILGRTPSGYLADLRLFRRDRVVIVGLNSCRLFNKRDAGLGYVGREQIEQVIRDLRADVSGGMSVVHCGGPGTAGPPALDGGEWSWQSRKWSQDENHVGCQGWRSIGISRAPDPAIDVQ